MRLVHAGLLMLLLPIALVAGQQYYGTRIAAIDIEGAPVEALDYIPLRAGDLLTPEGVRESIQALYDEGGYARIVVDAVATGAGTRVTFIVEHPFFFSTFSVHPSNLLERTLSGYLDLHYGERYSRSRLDRIVGSLAETLRREGYFEAHIEPVTDFEKESRLVTVRLDVDTAAKARTRNVRFDGGEQTFTPEELSDLLDIETGSAFSMERLESGIDGIRNGFAELGFLNTRVTFETEHVAESNVVDTAVFIEPGPFTLVQVRGFDMSDDDIRELVPVFEEGSVDPDLIAEGRSAILEHLFRQGYSQATVEFERFEVPLGDTLDNAVQINYLVDAGLRHTVRQVRFDGNSFFTEDYLLERIGIAEGGLFSRGSFSPRLLEQARDTIARLYRNAGFFGARVEPEHTIQGTEVTVTVRIDEGRRVPIVDILFSGNTSVQGSELASIANMFSGQTYTTATLEQGRGAITAGYHSRGFPDVRVRTTTELTEDGNGVRVTYDIAEGSSYRIGRVLVAGNTRTKEKVVLRNSQLFEGTPFDPESILEAQQRLYSTGLFNRVDIVPLEQAGPDQRDLLIQLEDAGPLLLTYGIGLQDREGLRGTVELSHTNLFGLDRSISFRARGSTREQRFQTTFREPRLFNWELDGFASLFVERTRQQFFDASRIDFSLQSLKRFESQDSLLMSASFQTVNLRDIRVNPRAGSFPDEVGTIQISRIGTSYIHDTRNDPINPSRGNYFTGSFQLANRAFGSEVDFTALFTQVSIYRPANEAVIAASARFGWNQPYGRTRALPITERYFAGGSTTLRSFGLDDAGPEGGGNALTILNAEYRFPIPFLISGLGGAAFYDTGTVFRHISDFNVGDFTHTLGFGIRYETPLGPIRVDFGFNLNRKPGESLNKVFFTLGHTF